jgi:hypothetical protein
MQGCGCGSRVPPSFNSFSTAIAPSDLDERLIPMGIIFGKKVRSNSNIQLFPDPCLER